MSGYHSRVESRVRVSRSSKGSQKSKRFQPSLAKPSAATAHPWGDMPHGPAIIDTAHLHAEAGERYRRKHIRREILVRFQAIQAKSLPVDKEEIFLFLSDYSSELDLVKQALEPYRQARNQWCIEAWKIIGNDDPYAVMTRLRMRFQGITPFEARELVATHVPTPPVHKNPIRRDWS